jgi:iron complex transport system substrate-binding protein
MRIVSLLPSATEIAVALGAGDALVGRSHECDWPPFVGELPALTRSKLAKGLTSQQIEDRVQAIVRSGTSVYEVDADALRALRPDVILTQTQCAVCAVTPADLAGALAEWTGTAPVLVSTAPDDLADVWRDFAAVGAAIGVDSVPVIADLQARIAELPPRSDRPTVAAIEWIEPLMIAGNWVPELVEAAGGVPILAAAGQHSPFVDFAALVAADPDVIVLMPCGYRIEQTLADLPALAARDGWSDLRAVRDARVYVADGQYFFNRPGPRLVESARILADCLADAPDGAWCIRLP